jgi:transposase
MGRYCRGLQLSPSSLCDLEELAAEAKSLGASDILLRIRGLIMVSRDHSYREVAACLGVTSWTVSNWVNHYLDDGSQALITKPRSGRPAELTEEEFSILEDLVDAGAVASGFPNDVWDARRVGCVIRSHFGISYHPHHVAKVLHARGFSVQKPQRMLALADATAQFRWETETKPEIARLARAKGARIFFEDEMSLATQGTVHQTWARVGQTPRCPVFGRYKGVKTFGLVSGSSIFRYRVQTACFTQDTFLAFLSEIRSSMDGFMIPIIDGAPYHKGVGVTDFRERYRDNFALYYLPSYSPELNPQEHVWKVFRKQHSHNQSYRSTAELLGAARSGFRSLQHSTVLQGVYAECQEYFA